MMLEEDDVMEMQVKVQAPDGSMIDCVPIEIFTMEEGGQEYIALLPAEDFASEDVDGTLYFYRYAESADGQPVLTNLMDYAEYERCAEAFREILMEEDEAEEEEAE